MTSLSKIQDAGIQAVIRLKTFRVIVALMLREMSATYGKSMGGYFWIIAEPALGIALITFVFTLALKSPSLGTNFAIFYATAYLPYNTFFLIHSKISSSFKYTQPLLNYPSVKFTDAIIARFCLNLMTQIAVFFIVIAFIEYAYDTYTIHRYKHIIMGMLMSAVLAVGIGTLNCFLFHYIPMYDRVWKIMTRPSLILSAVLYIYEDLPGKYQPYLWWNPIAHLTGETRKGFYPTYDAAYVSYLYVFGIAFVSMALGLFLLTLFQQKMIQKL